MAELTVSLDKKTCEALKRHYPGMTLPQAASAALSMSINVAPQSEALKSPCARKDGA